MAIATAEERSPAPHLAHNQFTPSPVSFPVEQPNFALIRGVGCSIKVKLAPTAKGYALLRAVMSGAFPIPQHSATDVCDLANCSVFAIGLSHGTVQRESPSEPNVLNRSAPFETEYLNLRGFRAAIGMPQAVSNLEFWVQQGEPGGRWLLDRLTKEPNLDVLDTGAAILRRMGAFVVPEIVRLLETEALDPEIAEFLLHALRRDSLRSDAGRGYARIVAVIERYIHDESEEVRQAAYETAAVLSRVDSVRLLDEAKRRETDPSMQLVIDEIKRHI